MLYSISYVTEKTGLTPRQLRYWETLQLICPQRSKGGHRRYSKEDMALLKKMADLKKDGLPLAEIRSLVRR